MARTKIHDHKRHLLSAVVKRSGISRITVELVTRAVFDEIRYQLTEGSECVAIDSFGSFGLVHVPERQRHYRYKDIDEIRTLPPTIRLRFKPSKNLMREVLERRFDPTRESLVRHPDDPKIKTTKSFKYNKRKEVHVINLTPALSKGEGS